MKKAIAHQAIVFFVVGFKVAGFKGAEGAEDSTGVVRRIKIKSAAKF